MLSNFVPKSEISLSPENNALIPPELGILLAASDITVTHLAAHSAVLIWGSLNVPSSVTNLLRPWANLGNLLPQTSISFSPAKKPATPPELGIFLAASDNATTALHAHFMLSNCESLNVPRLVAKFLILVPSDSISFPNLANEFPPVNIDINLLILFNKLAAVNAIIASATEPTLWAVDGFIFDAPFKNPSKLTMNWLRSLPNLGKLWPRLNILVIPVIILASANNNIAPDNTPTLPIIAMSMFLDPSKNGCKFVINCDKLVAIWGIVSDTPKPNPPIIPPINLPIAVPTACNTSPASWIPDTIPLSLPTNVITPINSTNNAPNATIPIAAAGADIAKLANKWNITTNIPIHAIPPSNVFGSNNCNASMNPLNIALNNSAIDIINSGTLSVTALIVWMNKSNITVTIGGTKSLSILTASSNTVPKALAINGAHSIITLQNSTIAKPNVLTISGINPTIPNMMADKPETIAVVPALNANANADIPVAINPRPTPNATAATPNNAAAPATINKPPATLLSKAPAIPNIVNAAANPNKALTILSGLIDANIFNPIANSINAAEAISNAPAPAKAPPILLPSIFIATTNIVNAPPIATNERLISSQFIVANIFNAPARTIIDVTAPSNPIDLNIPPFFGNKFITIVNMINEPAIAVKPRPISAQLIEPKIFNEPASIINEFANTSMDIDFRNAPSGFILLIINDITPKEINIVVKPFIIDNKSIEPIFFKATDIINNDKDKVINPFVFFLVLPSSGNKCIAAVKTPIAPAKPITPVIIWPKFKLPIFLIALPNINKLNDKLIKAKLLLAYILSFPILVNTLKHNINSVITRPIALILFTNDAPSILDKTHIDPTKIATALAIFINVLALISFW